MAVTRRSDPHLGGDLGLSDDDLVEMYRYVALARAVDERMWILNRAGRAMLDRRGRRTLTLAARAVDNTGNSQTVKLLLRVSR